MESLLWTFRLTGIEEDTIRESGREVWKDSERFALPRMLRGRLND